MSAPAVSAHPLRTAAPALAAEVAGVPGERAGAARRALGILAVQGTTAYTQGEVYGPLYGALQNGSAPDGEAYGKALAGLRELEADGMLMLARLERRVAEPDPAGMAPPSQGAYRDHRGLTWKVRAFLTALADPYPEQLLDTALCLRNGGFEDSTILDKLQG